MRKNDKPALHASMSKNAYHVETPETTDDAENSLELLAPFYSVAVAFLRVPDDES